MEALPDEDARAQEEECGEYEVEAILDKRVLPGRGKLGSPVVEYEVKWKHWNDTHNTWEVEDNLRGCQALVREFEERDRLRRGVGPAQERDARRARRDFLRLEREAGR